MSLKPPLDITAKIDEIVSTLSTDKAITKLIGYFKQYYYNNYLRVNLGRLYLKKTDFVNAGKWLYFLSNPNEEKERAIIRFKESCKNNKLRIFNSIIHNSKPPIGIDPSMSEKVFSLILSISEQEGSLPTTIVRWICYFNRVRNIEIKRS